MALSVKLRATTAEPVARVNEPVTVGLPWPRGAVPEDHHFRLIGPAGLVQTLETKVLDRWPDGSVRWCLFDFLVTTDGTSFDYAITLDTTPTPTTVNCPLRLNADERQFTLGTAAGDVATMALQLSGGVTSGLRLYPADAAGPIRTRDAFQCGFHREGLAEEVNALPLQISGTLDRFAGSHALRVSLTVLNPQAAGHPGGNWDLGNSGSEFFRSLSVVLTGTTAGIVRCSPERGTPLSEVGASAAIEQWSSGGENWQSANHLDRKRKITARPANRRATPIVAASPLAVTSEYFWENFPKAIHADGNMLRLGLFPEHPESEYELQGGEQKTHTFTLLFGPDSVTAEPLVWARSPLKVFADPEWYAASGAIPYLTPKANDPNATYLALVDQALDGPDTFLMKREKIDEYGWRHFGDIWGDHEAVYHAGDEPMISHYNNQYDCVAAFGIQFFRSGDLRWFAQMLECATHTCDIDVYHTSRDKSAYNHGLFWHTYHYAPADTGTHRSYPKSLRNGGHFESGQDLDKLGDTGATLKSKVYAVGGGPSAAHNYNAGLMLAYFLTGEPLYRDTAIDLAKFVLDMDDGRSTVFRWLCTGDTGLAIQSSAGYLGPGRAAANSLLAVLAGHQLTREDAYADKADQIVRRIVHPQQNLETLDLLNAELRWFYTMFLQALGRYLDYKIELDQRDETYAYAQLSLLHYARWMAAHERPILSQPEKLQYPTETWAAQDLRKVEVFQYAAKHAAGAEKAQFLERAEWFFRYVETTLSAFPPTDRGIPTKSLCRPVILMMKYGWTRAWWQQHAATPAPAPAVMATPKQFGEWSMFIPQKEKAMRRAKTLIGTGAVAGIAAIAGIMLWLVS